MQSLLAGCKMLARSEYFAKNNRALIMMAVAWAQNMKWYQKQCNSGQVLENSQAKLIRDFEFNLRKTATSRRTNLMLEEKQTKIIWIYDIACLQENIIEKKRLEKRTNYMQLAFEIKEKRLVFQVKVVKLVISVFGGGTKKVLKELKNMFAKDDLCKKTVVEMLETIFMDGAIIIRRVLSRLVQIH